MSRSNSVGKLSRAGIWLQVVLAGALALSAVLAINWLAARPGVRQRFDLTATGSASVDASTRGVLVALPGEVHIDVFFRPEPAPFERVAQDVQARTSELLEVMKLEAGDQLKITRHNMLDAVGIERRKLELRIRGLENCLIVSHLAPAEADRDPNLPEGVPIREVVPLFGRHALAALDPGNPDKNAYRAPAIMSFDGEKAILAAMLKVTQGRAPLICFSRGHGEGDAFELNGDPAGFGRLESILTADGFRTERWSGTENGDLPEDCSVLAILEPRTPFSDLETRSIEKFMAGGGRLVLAAPTDPGLLEASGLDLFYESFGVEITPGIVCEPKRDAATTAPVVGGPQVAYVQALPDDMGAHPITGPYKDAAQPLRVPAAHGLRVARQPRLGLAQAVVRSPRRAPGSWVDEPPFNWIPDDHENQKAQDLVIAWSRGFAAEAGAEVIEATRADGVVRENRIVFLGSGAMLQDSILGDPRMGPFNEPFARNLFNWATDREYRVSISSKDPAIQRAPAETVTRVVQVALWYLPLSCVLMGVLVSLLRRRGGPDGAPTGQPGSGQDSQGSGA